METDMNMSPAAINFFRTKLNGEFCIFEERGLVSIYNEILQEFRLFNDPTGKFALWQCETYEETVFSNALMINGQISNKFGRFYCDYLNKHQRRLFGNLSPKFTKKYGIVKKTNETDNNNNNNNSNNNSNNIEESKTSNGSQLPNHEIYILPEVLYTKQSLEAEDKRLRPQKGEYLFYDDFKKRFNSDEYIHYKNKILLIQNVSKTLDRDEDGFYTHYWFMCAIPHKIRNGQRRYCSMRCDSNTAASCVNQMKRCFGSYMYTSLLNKSKNGKNNGHASLNCQPTNMQVFVLLFSPSFVFGFVVTGPFVEWSVSSFFLLFFMHCDDL